MTYVWLNERPAGPFDDSTFDALLRGSALTAETFAWRDGMSEWVPLASLMHSAQGHDAALGVQSSNHPADGTEEALLAAMAEGGQKVGSGNLATVLVGRLRPEDRLGPKSQGNTFLSLYRWPQFGPDLGIYPAGEEPLHRTAANGTQLGREDFSEMLQKADAGDITALFAVADICFENADIQADPVIAGLLRSRGEHYFAMAVAKKHVDSESPRSDAAARRDPRAIDLSTVRQTFSRKV